jgi:hypothetical protein
MMLLLSAWLAFAGSALQSTPFVIEWTVYLRRAGPIAIGMSLDEVRRALGDPEASLQGNIPGAPVDDCAYLKSPRKPAPLALMFQRGRLVRAEVVGPGIRTAGRIGVGSTEDDVKRAYPGRIEVGPHKYTDGHYLTYLPGNVRDRDFRLLFETDGVRVTRYRTGFAGAVALVEGCA